MKIALSMLILSVALSGCVYVRAQKTPDGYKASAWALGANQSISGLKLEDGGNKVSLSRANADAADAAAKIAAAASAAAVQAIK